jgi:primosomal protein N' (replication factor Y)
MQTDFPDHPVFRALVAHDFDAFARTLLDERRVARLPPFAHLALLTAEAHGRAEVEAFLAAAHAAGRGLAGAGADVEVLSPVGALLARKAGFERGQMVVQSEVRGALTRFLPAFRAALDRIPGRRVRYALDVDPLELG